jgi:hypothetical protein
MPDMVKQPFNIIIYYLCEPICWGQKKLTIHVRKECTGDNGRGFTLHAKQWTEFTLFNIVLMEIKGLFCWLQYIVDYCV